jgi:hypothetical protein
LLSSVLGFVERYGWFIVLGLIVLVFLWKRFRPQLMRILKKWEEQQELKNYGKIAMFVLSIYSIHIAIHILNRGL